MLASVLQMDEQTITADSDAAFTPQERTYFLRRIGELGYGTQVAAARAAGIKQSEFSKLLHGKRPAKSVYRKMLLTVLGPNAQPAAAAAANVPRPVDTHNGGVSSFTSPPLASSVSTWDTRGGDTGPMPVGALRPKLHRIYRWGIRINPLRPGSGTRGTYEERPLALEHESELVGGDGFGVEVDNATLSNWEIGEDQALRTGWVVWCNPAGRDDIADGNLVVVAHPALGLRAGVYREDDGGTFIETDDPRLAEQERERVRPEWVAGPVVYATTGGTLHRRVRRQANERADPAGPAFLADRRTG